MVNRLEIASEILRAIKTMFIMLAIVSVIAVIVTALAYTPPTHTYSADHFTVDETADGEEVTILYEVVYEYTGSMDKSDRTKMMDRMDLVAMCANERLDSWVQSRAFDDIEGDLGGVVSDCDDGNAYVGSVQTR